MEYKKKSTVTTTSYSIKRVIKALFKKHNNNNNKKNSNRNPTTRSLESLESLDNYRNSQYEEYYEEIGDNAANEKLLSCIYNDMNNYQYHTNDSFDNYDFNHDTSTTTSNTISNITSTSTPLLADTSIEEVQQNEIDEEDIFVPVRFARTEVGTYFWTTNLQPAAIITTVTTPLGDNLDLIQPTICYSTDQQYHYPQLQYQDRWAQA